MTPQESCIVVRCCRVMLSSGDTEGGPRPILPRTRKSYGPVGWALAHLQRCIRMSGDSKSDVIGSVVHLDIQLQRNIPIRLRVVF